jgi:hypothetical protein
VQAVNLTFTVENVMSKASKPVGPGSTTVATAARAQSAVARANGGQVTRGSYVGRLQAAAAKHVRQGGTKR